MQENLISIQIVPFRDNHLKDAAVLVATRYRTERALNKSLPARFEDAGAVASLLQDYTKERAGVVAIRGGRLAGFLTYMLLSGGGGRTAYVPDWGHAADSIDRRETYRTMYASVARRWVTSGYFTHAVTVLAHEREVMDTWFSLGFGMIEINALRDVNPISEGVAEVEIRRVGPEDIDLVLTLRVALQRHVAAAPVFIPLIIHRGRKHYEQWLPDSTNALWLAYRDGDTVAFMELEPSSRLGVVMPVFDETTVTITGAFTKEDIRQHGIGAALLNHSLEWARSAGYKNCAVEVESTNIVGSSFWHGKGFKPVCYSLARHIDERIAWAHEDRNDADLCWNPHPPPIYVNSAVQSQA